MQNLSISDDITSHFSISMMFISAAATRLRSQCFYIYAGSSVPLFAVDQELTSPHSRTGSLAFSVSLQVLCGRPSISMGAHMRTSLLRRTLRVPLVSVRPSSPGPTPVAYFPHTEAGDAMFNYFKQVVACQLLS